MRSPIQWRPVFVVLDLLPETLDVYVHRAGVPNIFIPPDMVQGCSLVKTWLGEDARSKGAPAPWAACPRNGPYRARNNWSGLRRDPIFHKLSLLLRHRGDGGGTGLVAAQDGLYPGHQLLGVEGLYHIVVGSQLQPQDLVEDLSLGRKHDDGDLGDGAQLPGIPGSRRSPGASDPAAPGLA